MKPFNFRLASLALGAFAIHTTNAAAGDWSDTSLGYRYAYHQSEPGVVGEVNKNIFSIKHASGDKFGSNFLTADLLMSHGPDYANGGTDGAQEVYGFFQRNMSLAKVSGHTGGYGFFKDLNLVGRFDFGTKNTTFAPRPRKLRFGISADLPVAAGFWSAGVQVYKETNHNGFAQKNVTFDTTAVATTAWALPVGDVGTFGGFIDVIGPKGKDANGIETGTEIYARGTFMFNLAGPGSPWKAGVGMEYWKNKFGNRPTTVAFAPGSTKATTLLLLLEYRL